MIDKLTSLKKKRGFSIMETVIALAVIVIVTVAALSIVVSSVIAKANLTNRLAAQGFAQDVWECFKASQTKAEFEDNLSFALDDNEGLEYDTSRDIYVYHSKQFRAKININDSFDELSVAVTDQNGEEIISFSYDKHNASGVSE